MGYQKGKRLTLSEEAMSNAETALRRYRSAQDSAKIASEAADVERATLLGIIGDAQYAVDSDGRTVFSAPEQTRRTMPVDEALAVAPITASVMKTTVFRVIRK